MEELDRWALDRLARLNERLTMAYDDFEFHLVYHGLHNFCVLDLSSFYLDIIKDRLYTSPKKSRERRSAQTAMNVILETLVRLMAPILSFTADEIWGYMEKQGRLRSVHADIFFPLSPDYIDNDLADRWDTITAVRKEVTKALEISRREKVIGHSLDASVTLGVPKEFISKLARYKDDLRYIFIVSSVTLTDSGSMEGGLASDTMPGIKVMVEPSRDQKCDRCWVRDQSVGTDSGHPTVCARCLAAMNSK
jgi:isoleucyl-tRNA synthetase